MLSIWFGHEIAIQTLVQYGINIKKCYLIYDQNGMTLHMAAAIESFKMVELLLDLDLSIDKEDWAWKISLIQVMREIESLKNNELIDHLIPTVALLLKSDANSKTGI